MRIAAVPVVPELVIPQPGAVENVTVEPVAAHIQADPSSTPPTLLPAAFIEIDHPQVAAPADHERLAEIATHFTKTIDQSGLDPESGEYRALWDSEKRAADARFKALYGSRAWMAHHIANHHHQTLPSRE